MLSSVGMTEEEEEVGGRTTSSYSTFLAWIPAQRDNSYYTHHTVKLPLEKSE